MRVLAALAVYVAVEIGLLVLLGQAIGFLGLLAALVVSAVVGAGALKREGRRSFAALTRAAPAAPPRPRWPTGCTSRSPACCSWCPACCPRSLPWCCSCRRFAAPWPAAPPRARSGRAAP